MELKRFAFGLILASIASFSVPAYAAQYHCDGVPQGVSVGPDGRVFIMNFGGHPFTYSHWCNLTQTVNGIAPETCRGMLTVFLSAEAQGKQVRVWFDDTLTCATRGPWGWQTGLWLGPMVLPN